MKKSLVSKTRLCPDEDLFSRESTGNGACGRPKEMVRRYGFLDRGI